MENSEGGPSAQPVSIDPQELEEELLSDWYLQQQEQAGESSTKRKGEEHDPDPDYEDDEDDEYREAEDGEDIRTERDEAEMLASINNEDEDEEMSVEEESDEEGSDEEDDDDVFAAVGLVQIIQDLRPRFYPPMDPPMEDINANPDEPLAGAGLGWLSRAQLMRLLGRGRTSEDRIQRLAASWPPDPDRFPKVPSERGIELMHSGDFGATDKRDNSHKHLARRILDRELGFDTKVEQQMNQDLMLQNMIPSTQAEMIVHYDSAVYSGQFSEDGNFFYACGHDFKVRMYDTSSPYNWEYYKTVEYPMGQWTLTDASLSPDNKWLAYTSIHPNVCLAPTDPNDKGDPYTLNLAAGTDHYGFGIWSVRFSGDGRELVAGTNSNAIVVYDIESRTVLHYVHGHEDDVNAVCFADKSSPHILYSGSDDATIKVWDRRSMGDGRPAGAFIGHTEGLTYIDSKDDGRYILSNGKDQTMKLWDLRTVMSTDRFRELNPTRHTRDSDFDYRMGYYHDSDWMPHPSGDNSVVTFRGHKVLRTLIRCHFSPPGSTNSRYVYTGSQDGKVWIYNIDATVAGIIDVNKATENSRILSRNRLFYPDDVSGWKTCVRDASWHPNAPLLVASSWNGSSASVGTCTLHSYNEAGGDEAEPSMGRSVDERLNRRRDLFDV